MSEAQAPDLGFLQGLEPGVAYAALAVIGLGMVLFAFGPALRERLARKPPAVSETLPAIPAVPPSVPQAADRSDQVTDQFLDHLLRENAKAAAENEQLERELRELRDENTRLRTQLWRRAQ